MDFIKSLFGEEPLSCEQFCEKLSESGIQLADISSGEYITLKQHESAISAANADTERLKAQYESDISSLKKHNAVDVALLQSGAKDLVSVRAHIDMDGITCENGGISGLDEQIRSVMESCPYLFGGDSQTAPTTATGMRLSSGSEHTQTTQLDYSKLSDSEYYGIMEQQNAAL